MRRLKKGEQLNSGDHYGHPTRGFVPAHAAPKARPDDDQDDHEKDGFYRDASDELGEAPDAALHVESAHIESVREAEEDAHQS